MIKKKKTKAKLKVVHIKEPNEIKSNNLLSHLYQELKDLDKVLDDILDANRKDDLT